MTCCYTYYSSDKNYLKSPVGCLKCLNIIFGAISLALLFTNFVPVPEDRFCLTIVIFSLTCSTIYFILYALYPELRYFQFNRRFDNAYHLLIGFLLILAGIDLGQLIGRPGRFFQNVHDDDESCIEPGYAKGAAKIIIFINGVLYEIIGFIRVKGDGDGDNDSGGSSNNEDEDTESSPSAFHYNCDHDGYQYGEYQEQHHRSKSFGSTGTSSSGTGSGSGRGCSCTGKHRERERECLLCHQV